MAGCRSSSICRDPGGDDAAGRLHDARVQPRAHLARSGAAPDRAADLSPDRGRRDARDALDGIRGRDAAVQRRVDAGALPDRSACSSWLPWNPQGFAAVPPDLAFNTAASFTTNTNWQAYSGESTMSYLTQMAGLAYHNFVSAAIGIALAIAFIRGIAQKEKDTHRQLLGRSRPLLAVGAAAVLHRRRAVPRLAGRRPEPPAVRQGGGRSIRRRSRARRRRQAADDGR